MADSGIVLSSSHNIPVLGLGVWRTERKLLHSLILEAICLGYHRFKCAADYKNEKEALAELFRQGVVKSSDLFITTKLWNFDHGYVWEACEGNFKNLQLDYLDLYLVHFLVATSSTLDGDEVLDIDVTISLETTWHAMEDLVFASLVRSIGINNFGILLMRNYLAYSKIKPTVNTIETHPYF
ncbi:hypothetical protein L7F22_033780 [Adiantum nelumboides]|nr:hypothetical protein [Adiantum nelumboides]